MAIRDEIRASARRVKRFARLFARDCIVSLRYRGTLGGVAGGESFEMLFVGREAFAREFELYLGKDRRSLDATTVFRGNLVMYAAHRRRLARQASSADLVVREDFVGGRASGDEIVHHPMLEGHLRVEQTLEAQIHRVRSRSQQRLMRGILRKDAYEERLASGRAAVDSFYTTLHAPYVAARFGAWGVVDDRDDFLRSSNGSVMLIARRDRPERPVCGALLHDSGTGTLDYFRTGFDVADGFDADLIAERTAALELATMRHAISRGFSEINFGHTRGILGDGLVMHKHLLGCVFAPADYSPTFRVRARPGRRAAVFARYPLPVWHADGCSAVFGYDDQTPRHSMQDWEGRLKSKKVEGLGAAVVWSNARNAEGREGETTFVEALCAAFKLPRTSVDLRADVELT